ncbi:hypothetical protein DFH07DRAFT_951823 [Mycena maculata]|uniref:Uncharacterized protein n=1 Tax=Mycena maculata TaxID=230809 RepID=A0AAD7K0X8_9AGAR|nr:hypothetical protein DFH07DRAFT_951823 [Mycena maculata]
MLNLHRVTNFLKIRRTDEVKVARARTSEIGRLVAMLMWATRGVILCNGDGYDHREAQHFRRLRPLQKFLINGEDTLMAYLYTLIKSIRGEEYNEASSQISDWVGSYYSTAK